MHKLVAADDMAGLQRIVMARHAGDEAAGLAHDDLAGRDVPGLQITPAMMVSSRCSAIEIANCGMPCRKLVVPSSGSTIQVWLWSAPARVPPSSPRKP